MLAGYVDQFQPGVVSGWAADTDAPESVVSVVIYVDDQRVATVACDRDRPDLQVRADLRGSVRHGFRHEFAAPLELARIGRISVRFARTGELLTGGQRAGERQPALAPILVSAPGRSGTTFLMNRLLHSPRICAVEVPPFEVRLLAYWSAVFQALTGGPDFARSTDPGHLEGDGFRAGSNPFAHGDYQNAFAAKALAASYFGQFVPDAAADFIRTVVGEYYLRLRDDQGKQDATYFAEKGNNIHRPARVVSRILYPELKEIVIVRDPRDLFCSHVSYFRQGASSAFNDVSFSCEELLRMWRAASGREVFVKYEDMILDEHDAFARLSAFLGVPDLAQRNSEKEDAVFRVHATTKSPKDSIGRWRELPAEDVRRCNTAWEEFIDTFGYER